MNRSDVWDSAVQQMVSLYRLAHRLGAPIHICPESLVGDAYAVAWERLEDAPLNEKSLRLWLYGILYAVLRARVAGQDGDTRIEESDVHASSDAAAKILSWYKLSNDDWEQVGARLERAIDELPLQYRIVFLLWSAEGLSTRQIAFVVEAEESTVRSRLCRATMSVATQLGEVATGWLEECETSTTV